MLNKRFSAYAINRIDFTAPPFITLASGDITLRSNYHRFPIFNFPHGVPAVGDAIRLYISTDARRDKPMPALVQNAQLADGTAQTRDDLFARRQVIRVLPCADHFKPRFKLSLSSEDPSAKAFEWYNPRNAADVLRFFLARIQAAPIMPPTHAPATDWTNA